jgi:Fe-S-cluster containining protein
MRELLGRGWEQRAEGRQKEYASLLKKKPRRDFLVELPELHKQAFREINCLECAKCCKKYSPRFKTPDIKRIARLLGMKEGDFIRRYLRLDEEGDYVANVAPCPFLGSDNRCGIYADRPSDCRRFPYTDEDVFFKRQALTLQNSRFCPIVYSVLERLLAAPQRKD